MKTYELYLTDSAPNGTNDLIIVDPNSGEIIASVEEVTFGYPGMRDIKPNAVAYGPECFVGGLPEDGEKLSEYDGYLYSVDTDTLRSYLCVSPVDPKGLDLVKRLKSFGVKVSNG
jgi:hypothetical protein